MLRPAPRTHRHTHSHAHSDPRTRGGPRAHRRSRLLHSARLILFHASSISICRAGFPPAPGEPAYPGWSFPEFRVLGWAEQGRPVSLLRPAGPRSPGHNTAALEAIARTEAGRGFPRDVPLAPGAARGSLGWASVSWASQSSPAASVEEVYFVLVAERRARGELAAPPPHSRSHLVSQRNVVPLGVQTCEKWGPGWRSGIAGVGARVYYRSVALETGLRDREVSRSGFPSLSPQVSPNICTHNPSNSGWGVCSPTIEESPPSGLVLERTIRWTLSRV